MTKAWAIFVVLLGIVTGALAIVTGLGFYPIGVIALLVIALLSVTAASVQKNRDTLARDHDARVIAEIRGLVPRDSIDWLRNHDFGDQWSPSSVEPFRKVIRLNEVENRPINRGLAREWEQFLCASQEFCDVFAQNVFNDPDPRGVMWSSVGWTGSQAETLVGSDSVLFLARRALLNKAADHVSASYDEFVDAARTRLLLPA
jgi:hypothetical protein